MKIKVILNPNSKKGNGKFLVTMLEEKLVRFHVDVEQTAHPLHATEIARHAVKEGVDIVVAVGGDGTVNEVINGIIHSHTPLGIIPTGMANDLASLYQIPIDPMKACDVILDRNVQKSDAICINGWYFATAGGIGLPCEVAHLANRIKGRQKGGNLIGAILGSKLYVLATLCRVLSKPAQRDRVQIQWDGHTICADPLWLTINNQQFLAKHFLMAPGAINDDGQFDVCMARNPKERTRIISLATSVITGKHLDLPVVKFWRTKEMLVKCNRPMTFFGDGEVIPMASELRIRICPRALSIVTPRNNASKVRFSEWSSEQKLSHAYK